MEHRSKDPDWGTGALKNCFGGCSVVGCVVSEGLDLCFQLLKTCPGPAGLPRLSFLGPLVCTPPGKPVAIPCQRQAGTVS